MARILCLDYGKKRTGVAVSDPMQIIASGLATIDSRELVPWLKKYLTNEEVELFLVGYPLNEDGTATDATPLVENCLIALKKHFPAIPVQKMDERYSSKMASAAILEMGLKKKQRQDKGLIDEVAAVMMLREYMEKGAL